MRGLPAVLLSCLLAGAVLAGCSGSDPPSADQPDDAAFDDLGLAASETTGVIRGVVVDEAIRPVPGATVSLSGGAAKDTTSNAEGLFGFADLEPGPYFVRVEKAGFVAAQASAEVVAGVSEPEILKVLLTADPSTVPYVSTYVFDGFIECSFSLVAVGFAACSSVGQLNDRFITVYPLDRPPQWVQSEMVWQSTQAISPELDLVYSAPGEGALLDNYAEAWGVSPLLIQVNETLAAERGLGSGTDLMIRVFNQPIEGTETGDPVGGDDCLDRPALGGCTTGLGATVEQGFTIITNAFYGFTPDPAWRYVDSGPYPTPA